MFFVASLSKPMFWNSRSHDRDGDPWRGVAGIAEIAGAISIASGFLARIGGIGLVLFNTLRRPQEP